MTSIHILDFVGSVFSFLSTVCYIRLSSFAWPLGLVSIVISIILYSQKGIYGDVGLHCIYLCMTFYGWWQWQHVGKNRSTLGITHLDRKKYLFLTVLFLVSVVGLSYGLKSYTDSKIPYLDAITTCLSLIAQWMTCRKIIQTWYLWFVVDALFAGMYVYKGIPFHAGIQCFYLSLAVVGYLQWKKQASLLPLAECSSSANSAK